MIPKLIPTYCVLFYLFICPVFSDIYITLKQVFFCNNHEMNSDRSIRDSITSGLLFQGVITSVGIARAKCAKTTFVLLGLN